MHYTSIGTDKEYFADALILKALDFEGEKQFTKLDKPKLFLFDQQFCQNFFYPIYIFVLEI